MFQTNTLYYVKTSPGARNVDSAKTARFFDDFTQKLRKQRGQEWQARASWYKLINVRHWADTLRLDKFRIESGNEWQFNLITIMKRFNSTELGGMNRCPRRWITNYFLISVFINSLDKGDLKVISVFYNS